MGALTGNTVQSTYLDLVQLGQSGAGLPAHAGKEAALYDGSGAQILGRTAVRHWLDPHPDAASFDETWEFSTTGDMTQGELETAGWTFTNCTGAVSGGALWITKAVSASNVWYASLDVSFSGDFDVFMTPTSPIEYLDDAQTTIHHIGGIGVADYRAGTADVAHYVILRNVTGVTQSAKYLDGAYTTLAGTLEADTIDGSMCVTRALRRSGSVRLMCGSVDQTMSAKTVFDSSFLQNYGWPNTGAKSDASTFNKLFFTMINSASDGPDKFGILNIRRFQ